MALSPPLLQHQNSDTSLLEHEHVSQQQALRGLTGALWEKWWDLGGSLMEELRDTAASLKALQEKSKSNP